MKNSIVTESNPKISCTTYVDDIVITYYTDNSNEAAAKVNEYFDVLKKFINTQTIYSSPRKFKEKPEHEIVYLGKVIATQNK
jgi:hypothetical protein